MKLLNLLLFKNFVFNQIFKAQIKAKVKKLIDFIKNSSLKKNIPI